MKRKRLSRKTPRRFARPETKFSSQSCTYDGRTYHSRKEANYARTLDLLKHVRDPAQRVAQWKAQARVPLDVNGKHICDYYCDFLVEFADGRHEWHEVKGFATPEWRLKEKLFRAIYPDEVLKIIK